jgi:hypothetical protein
VTFSFPFASILILAFLVAVQGVLLQRSCALAGERPPPYGEALATALIAGLVSGVGGAAFGCTAGLLIGLFSRWAAWLAGELFALALTASVYRGRLGLRTERALLVAVFHHVLAALVSAAVWGLLRLVG